MTRSHRLEKKGRGRLRKSRKLSKQPYKSLGCIPMKVKKGVIAYKQKIPNNYSIIDKIPTDAEEQERGCATLPIGEGSFIRRHIYEMRFGIGEETEEERRKREYEEWWDRQC